MKRIKKNLQTIVTSTIIGLGVMTLINCVDPVPENNRITRTRDEYSSSLDIDQVPENNRVKETREEYSSSFEDVFEIIQTEAGITCSEEEHPVLATYGIGPCVAIAGYEPNLKIGFIAHVDELTSNPSQTIVGNLERVSSDQNYEVTLIGGNEETSRENVQKIIDNFTLNNLNPQIKFEIVDNELYEEDLNIKSIALDTRTGELYDYNPMKAGTCSSIIEQRKVTNKKIPLIAMRDYPTHLLITYFPDRETTKN